MTHLLNFDWKLVTIVAGNAGLIVVLWKIFRVLSRFLQEFQIHMGEHEIAMEHVARQEHTSRAKLRERAMAMSDSRRDNAAGA